MEERIQQVVQWYGVEQTRPNRNSNPGLSLLREGYTEIPRQKTRYQVRRKQKLKKVRVVNTEYDKRRKKTAGRWDFHGNDRRQRERPNMCKCYPLLSPARTIETAAQTLHKGVGRTGLGNDCDPQPSLLSVITTVQHNFLLEALL
jgi:hypothetical protein